MRLLYVPSGHPLQEADDCLMWEALNIDWVSTGYYSQVEKPGDLPLIVKKDSVKELYEKLSKEFVGTHNSDKPSTLCGKKNLEWTGSIARNKPIFSKDFLSNFDVVVFNHFSSNVVNNIGSINKECKVVLKTYGMHPSTDEKTINTLRRKGVIVVRNSPAESLTYKEYGGHSHIIRGSVVKDEHQISGWSGSSKDICTFSSFFYSDNAVCSRRRDVYNRICSILPYNRIVCGAGTPKFASHEEKLEILKKSRVNLVVGTPGANNTYSFVEALVMGQPTVVFGPKLWQSHYLEIPNLGENGKHFFISDDPFELSMYIKELMENDELANNMSKEARKLGIELFGRDNLKERWRNVLLQ